MISLNGKVNTINFSAGLSYTLQVVSKCQVCSVNLNYVTYQKSYEQTLNKLFKQFPNVYTYHTIYQINSKKFRRNYFFDIFVCARAVRACLIMQTYISAQYCLLPFIALPAIHHPYSIYTQPPSHTHAHAKNRERIIKPKYSCKRESCQL